MVRLAVWLVWKTVIEMCLYTQISSSGKMKKPYGSEERRSDGQMEQERSRSFLNGAAVLFVSYPSTGPHVRVELEVAAILRQKWREKLILSPWSGALGVTGAFFVVYAAEVVLSLEKIVRHVSQLFEILIR